MFTCIWITKRSAAFLARVRASVKYKGVGMGGEWVGDVNRTRATGRTENFECVFPSPCLLNKQFSFLCMHARVFEGGGVGGGGGG